jgi:hypothetical protein
MKLQHIRWPDNTKTHRLVRDDALRTVKTAPAPGVQTKSGHKHQNEFDTITKGSTSLTPQGGQTQPRSAPFLPFKVPNYELPPRYSYASCGTDRALVPKPVVKVSTGDCNTHTEGASVTISDHIRNGVTGKHEVEGRVRDDCKE